MTHDQRIPLPYGTPPPLMRRRGVRRIITIAAALLVTVLLGRMTWPWILQRYEFLGDQKHCMNWSEPDAIMYQAGSFELDGGGSHSSSIVRGNVPWRRLRNRLPPRLTSPTTALLFVHAQQAPNQQKQIIAVEYEYGDGVPSGHIDLQWYSAEPGGWFSDPNWITGQVNLPITTPGRRGVITFLAGYPDPNDPSRFSIPFRLDNVPGNIDGHLQPNGEVKLQLRDGPHKDWR